MKKTYFKDVLRNIARHKVSFASIVIISMMAVLAFLGITYGGMGIRNMSDVHYRNLGFRDFEITSTYLLSEEDIRSIRNQTGVADVEGMLQISALIQAGKESQTAYLTSLTHRMNKVLLRQGRLPQTETECVLEEDLFNLLHLKLGQSIHFTDEKGGPPAYFKYTDLTVVGVVYHPNHVTEYSQDTSPRYVLVMEEAFDTKALPFEGLYMSALIRLDKPEGSSYFSDDYLKLCHEAGLRLTAFSEGRALMRQEKVTRELTQAIESGETELADGKIKLDESLEELEKGKAELESGRKTLEDSRKELEEGRVKIEEGQALLEEKRGSLLEAEKQLQEAEAQLEKGRKELDEGKKTLDEKALLLEEARKELEEGAGQLDEARSTLDEGKKLLEEGRAKLDDGWAQVGSGEAQLRTSFQFMEQIKTALRNSIRQTVADVAGESAAQSINWASPVSSFDVNDASLSPSLFRISDTITIDFRKSPEQLAAELISPLDARFAGMAGWEETRRTLLESRLYNDMSSSYREIAAQLSAWDQGHASYLEGRQQVLAGEAEYNAKRQEYLAGEDAYYQAYMTFLGGRKAYEEGLLAYLEGKTLYEDGLDQYAQGLAKYAEGLKQYQEGKSAFDEAEKELDMGRLRYENGLSVLEAGENQLAEAETRLSQGEELYQKGLEEYEAGAARLAQAKEQRTALGVCRWVLLGPQSNPGYFITQNTSESVSRLGMYFAFLFILIAALVIYTTIKRMINEQRRQVGISKALGFFTREVAVKYLVFGCLGALTGILLGILTAYFGLQTVVLQSCKVFFLNGLPTHRVFLTGLTLLVLVAGLLLSALAVWVAVSSLVREPARDLMQDKVPSLKRSARGQKKQSHYSLYGRLILRNIRSDLSRVLITILSIAGCCVLLVIGFTVRHNINATIDREYGTIIRYEEEILFKGDSPSALEEIQNILRDAACEFTVLYTADIAYRDPNEVLQSSKLICLTQEQAEAYWTPRDKQSGRTISLPSRGILMGDVLATELAMKPGTSFTLYDSRMEPFEAAISQLYEKYFYGGFLLTPEAYREIFGQEAIPNTLWVKNIADRDQLIDRIARVEGFVNSQSIQDARRIFTEMSSIVALLTLLLAAIAGIMAYFVLLNLVSMYVLHKTRELTIMRINGFTTRESIRYVAGESVLNTVAGILLGLVLGNILAFMIIRMMQQPQTGLTTQISWMACLLSAAITALYSIIINFLAMRPIRNLKLTDLT